MRLRKHGRAGSRTGTEGRFIRWDDLDQVPSVPVPDGKVRCAACSCPATVTPTGRLRAHTDRAGDECPNKVGPGLAIHVQTPPVNLPAARGHGLLATGECHQCGKPVTGERKYCGQCAARRRQ